jgi:hypothetical protein
LAVQVVRTGHRRNIFRPRAEQSLYD